MDEVGFQESTDENDRISSMVWGWADQGATFPKFFLKANTENFILTLNDSTQQIYEALEEYLRYNFCPGVIFSFGVSREVLKDSFPF